jgi:hypothetical protein
VRFARSLALLVTLALGCGGPSRRAGAAAGDSLSERQRDSMLANSPIPGARGVGRAMSAADSMSARVRAADTISP